MSITVGRSDLQPRYLNAGRQQQNVNGYSARTGYTTAATSSFRLADSQPQYASGYTSASPSPSGSVLGSARQIAASAPQPLAAGYSTALSSYVRPGVVSAPESQRIYAIGSSARLSSPVRTTESLQQYTNESSTSFSLPLRAPEGRYTSEYSASFSAPIRAPESRYANGPSAPLYGSSVYGSSGSVRVPESRYANGYSSPLSSVRAPVGHQRYEDGYGGRPRDWGCVASLAGGAKIQVTVEGFKSTGNRHVSGNSELICVCEIPGKHGSKFETRVGMGGSRAPHGIQDYCPGDNLQFALLDQHGDMLGKATLVSSQFHPYGYNADLTVGCESRGIVGLLRVTVVVSADLRNAPNDRGVRAPATRESAQLGSSRDSRFQDSYVSKRENLGHGEVMTLNRGGHGFDDGSQRTTQQGFPSAMPDDQQYEYPLPQASTFDASQRFPSAMSQDGGASMHGYPSAYDAGNRGPGTMPRISEEVLQQSMASNRFGQHEDLPPGRHGAGELGEEAGKKPSLIGSVSNLVKNTLSFASRHSSQEHSPRPRAPVEGQGSPYKLQVHVVSATKLSAADFLGKSDPYVTVELQGKPDSKKKTSSITQTLEPEWNEILEIPYYVPGDRLLFEVFDWDAATQIGLKSDDLLGKCELDDYDIQANFEGEMVLTDVPDPKNKGLSKLSVKIEVSYADDGMQAGPYA